MGFQLDHVIILIPYQSLVALPIWITDNFTVTPGGRHADNKTENKLVCFRDGSYIEFIAFIDDDPQNREGHWWGTKNFGIIDFAFTSQNGDAMDSFAELKQRLGRLSLKGLSNVEYQNPVAGGRKRPDGKDVKWNVTFPVVNTGYQRGEIPFFTHDVTPRTVRVPCSAESVHHPNQSNGVNGLTIYVPEERLKEVSEAYSAILGVQGNETGLYKVARLVQTNQFRDIDLKVTTTTDRKKLKALQENGGVLLGDLTLGSGENGTLKRIDIEGGGLGGIFVQRTG